MTSERLLTVESLGSFEEYSSLRTRSKVTWVGFPALEHASRPERRRYNRVLLLNPHATLFKGDLPRCTYPLGIGYIAAVLERYGYVVRILDAFAEGFRMPQPLTQDPNFIRYGLPDEDVEKVIRDFGPDLIGVSSIFSNQADNVHHLLQLAKRVKPDVLTAIGGAHARYFPKACLADANLDTVFLGESELVFLKYLECLNGHGEMGDLASIAFRDGDAIRVNTAMDLIKKATARSDGANWDELDPIPFPAWHLYNMERYFELKAYQSPYTQGDRVGQIYTSRGCSALCTFCTTTNFWGNRLRRRSPENVVEELTILKEKYGINEFHVQDDNITNDMKHAKILFKALEKLGLPWATPQGTALWRMDEETLDLMVASGAYQITFAIESGIQRVLTDLIRKPLDLHKTQHLIRYARKIGLHVHGFFIIGMPPMFGHPGETIEEMQQTFRFAQDSGFDSASFFAATPIVGSELLSECVRQGFIDPGVNLYRMSYKQGLINVPGLWEGRQVADLAAQFNCEINAGRTREKVTRPWTPEQY